MMVLHEVTEVPVQKKVYVLTILLGLTFFILTFYLRNSLADFSVPFAYVFVGMVLISFLSGRAENFILLLLIVTSTVFELLEFPTIPIMIGDLYFSDLLIILLLVGRLLKRITQNVTLLPGPMSYPLLVMILIGIFSFLYSTIGLNAPTNVAGVELRAIVHLAFFFLVCYYVRTERQLRTLLLALSVIASLVALLLVSQYVVGSSLSIVSGRVEILSTTEGKFSDVTRVLVPGSSLMLFSLNTLMALYLLKGVKRRWYLLVFAGIAVLTVGIILTFTRVFWVMIVLALFLILWISRRKTVIYPRLAILLTISFLAAAFMLQAKVMNPEVIKKAIINRSVSILRAPTNFHNDTLFMRYLESRYAWQRIQESPLLGIGLGKAYRPQIFGRTEYELTVGGTFLHNGYLATQLKLGLGGTLVFFWLFLAFFVRFSRRWKKINSPLYQAVSLGIAVTLCGMLVHNLVASPFMTVYWTAMAATGIGIIEKIYQFEDVT